MPRQPLHTVITDAVNDLATHGYDSPDRVAYWQQRIREAAEAQMASAQQMETMLREALAAVYRRMVESGGAIRYHPGVSRFTLDRLAPALRTELDRRILASADLIRLNRRQAIDKTLQRFAGWSTSIPAGGSRTVDKVDEKATIKRALSALPFEERRVLIDQGHKLTASINETIASNGGALALEWRSRWRQPGYDYRPDHKERDGRVYLLRGSWAQRAGLIRPGDAGYYDKVTAVAQEPFCRCYATYLYALRDLPDDMLTAKGRAELARVRKELAA